MTTRRDFLKLCASALAATQLPGVVVAQPESKPLDLDAQPLQIFLLSVTARILAHGQSRPEDGEHDAIEFEVRNAGTIRFVALHNLDTGGHIGTFDLDAGEEIIFNTRNIMGGDSVRISALTITPAP